MKLNLRTLSLVLAFVLCFGLLAACGGKTEENTKPASGETTTAPAESEAFVIPPDQMGKIVAADSTLITWNEYASEDKTIDFMGVDTKALKDPSEEITLFYLEEEVTYYLIKEGKLVDATIDDVVPDSIIGITTLEEGVQEVYIISVPVEDNGEDEVDVFVDDIVEIPVTTTSSTEDVVEEGSDEVNE